MEAVLARRDSGGALDERWWWSDLLGIEQSGRPLDALPGQTSPVLAELGLGTHHDVCSGVRTTNRSPHTPRLDAVRCVRTELTSITRLNW